MSEKVNSGMNKQTNEQFVKVLVNLKNKIPDDKMIIVHILIKAIKFDALIAAPILIN